MDDSSAQTNTSLSTWTDETDVVVVGFGGAGAVAAIEAVEKGADVIALDRFGGGGATAISGGVFYAGGGTSIQSEAGIEDDPDNMFRYLQAEVDGVVSDETLRRFCDDSRANLTWLQERGVPFEASLCPVKTSYPTDDYFLYYSGNESFSPWKELARPAARGHRAKGKSLPGANFYEPLRAAALRAGVRARYCSTATRLLHDDAGRVIGVEVRELPEGSPAYLAHLKLNRRALKLKNYAPGYSKKLWKRADRLHQEQGVIRRIRARNGVILAAGGFIFNRDMLTEHAPAYRPGMPLGTWADDGAGITLGQQAGASTGHMDRVSAWRFINPPQAWTEGFIVNKAGARYVNEQLYGAAIGEKMVEENEGKALLIIDRDIWKRSRSQVMWGRAQWFQAAPAILNLYFNARKARTIEELATLIKVDVNTLKATLADYNASIEEGRDDAFGKFDVARKVLKPPFYAIDCSITSKRFPCPTLTLGGLRVDEQSGLVLTEAGDTIPGLYAAGRNAVGICSRQYVSGLSIADCVFSGRRAGAHAAEEAGTSEA